MPQMPQSLAMPQTVSVSTAPETAAPKTDAASLQEQVPQMMQRLTAPQTVEQSAAGQAQMASEEGTLQTADVEILAKIPVPRPRPTAATTRKSMPALPRSVRALITQPPSADPTSLTTLLTPALNRKGGDPLTLKRSPLTADVPMSVAVAGILVFRPMSA
jgi:hypothetical protein